jgi:branched-subunit amino acid aminotransferase/4-amino-4-deoxychorismate lyase
MLLPITKMKNNLLLNFNGKIIPQQDLIVGVENRALRYGDGLFESIRMIDGKIRFEQAHFDRLYQGMLALKMNIHTSFDFSFFVSEINALYKKNEIENDARIRFSVFRTDGGLYTPNSNNFLYLIELQPITEKGYQWNKKGLIVDIYSETRKDFGYLSKYKTINCLPYVLAGIAAQELNVDTSILLNSKDDIVEATNSNLFFVKDHMLFTPAIQDGCTDGVMRKVVIQIAQQLGIKVYENKVPLQSLAIADEIFLTNSTTGIQWVVGYRGKRYFSRVARLIYDELQKK